MNKADWLIPQWPAPVGVRAVFTTRQGGVSLPPYDTLNVGDHVGDAAAAVAENRQILQRAMACQPVFLQQVHGTVVLELSHDSVDGLAADACLTRQRGLACTIMVADCLPVLFAHLEQPVVAAAHAGWRGLAGPGKRADAEAAEPLFDGVLEATFRRFAESVGAAQGAVAPRTIAWLGPCIGPTAFEVGAEVKAAFEAVHPAAGNFFVAQAELSEKAQQTKFLADLPALARLRLRALGIRQIYGNDGSQDWCTVSQPSRFFSHRRDAVGGRSTGRMAACIWQD
jgi:copper oxidase (laccase) domain-containing protein